MIIFTTVYRTISLFSLNAILSFQDSSFTDSIPEIILGIIGIIIVIYLVVSYIFFLQTILLEGKKTISAFQRSRDLVKNNWTGTFGVLFTITVIIGFLYRAIEYIHPIGIIFNYIVIVPFFIICLTMLYFDLRMNKEGHRLTELTSEIQMLREEDRKKLL